MISVAVKSFTKRVILKVENKDYLYFQKEELKKDVFKDTNINYPRN